MPVCLIALGSNVDASDAVFLNALQELECRGVATLALSRIATTRPVGSDAGPPFLNAAATVESHLSPIELLQTLHRVEAAFGRIRTVHWGPRTLDLDLLLYGEEIADQPDLVIPHPAMWYRRFVLDPANEVAPEMLHPILKSTVGSLYHALNVLPLRVSLGQEEGCVTTSQNSHDLIERLNTDSTRLQWLGANDTAVDRMQCFARVILQRRSTNSTLRTQPRNTGDRSIIIESESAEQAYAQLTQLAAAILG